MYTHISLTLTLSLPVPHKFKMSFDQNEVFSLIYKLARLTDWEDYRLEYDPTGNVNVPINMLFGPQTARYLNNSNIGGFNERMPVSMAGYRNDLSTFRRNFTTIGGHYTSLRCREDGQCTGESIARHQRRNIYCDYQCCERSNLWQTVRGA